MKTKTQQGVNFQFRRNQVLSMDFTGFLRFCEPGKLNSFQLRYLFGCVSLELEDAANYGDLFTMPETRNFVQTLHAVWPCAGFFLDLNEPFGSPRGLGKLPILAYALCTVDLNWFASDSTRRCAIHVNERQLAGFCDQTFTAIEELGRLAEIPAEVLAGRKESVAQQLSRILEIV